MLSLLGDQEFRRFGGEIESKYIKLSESPKLPAAKAKLNMQILHTLFAAKLTEENYLETFSAFSASLRLCVRLFSMLPRSISMDFTIGSF